MSARIAHILAVPGVGGYYCEDLDALQSIPLPPGDRYTAPAVTPGFRTVREVAEIVSIGLVLEDGRVAWGDCVGVAYAGKAGRDPVFRSEAGMAAIRQVVAPFLEGKEVSSFRPLAQETDRLTETVEVERPKERLSRREFLSVPRRLLEAGEGLRPTERTTAHRPLHTAVRYGVTQALLAAVAMVRGVTMAEVIAEEWGVPLPIEPVPIHAQSGADRYGNAEKMIARRLSSLPHALVDDIPTQIGPDGSALLHYVRWLKERVQRLGSADYRPTFHLDVHGGLGRICDHNLGRLLGHLYALEKAADPYPLRIESPLILESRDAQIEAMARLREYIRLRGMTVRLVADEWANTLEDIRAFVEAGAADMIQVKMPDLGGVHNTVDAVLACRAGGVEAFLGGSCIETDISARVSVHVALATRPAMMLAKPGMGVDEAVMLVSNEMARTLALIGHRGGRSFARTNPPLQ